jgi:hypothetical protein
VTYNRPSSESTQILHQSGETPKEQIIGARSEFSDLLHAAALASRRRSFFTNAALAQRFRYRESESDRESEIERERSASPVPLAISFE